MKNRKGSIPGVSVFVSVGTHPQQFDRLLMEIDRLAETGFFGGKGVFAQSGHSNYAPKNFHAKKFLSLGEFDKMLGKCGVFITHSGEGNIGKAKNLGKKMIVVPRRKEYGEHTNDHQLELAEVVARKGIGLVAWNPDEVGARLKELEAFSPVKVEMGSIPAIIEKFVSERF